MKFVKVMTDSNVILSEFKRLLRDRYLLDCVQTSQYTDFHEKFPKLVGGHLHTEANVNTYADILQDNDLMTVVMVDVPDTMGVFPVDVLINLEGHSLAGIEAKASLLNSKILEGDDDRRS